MAEASSRLSQRSLVKIMESLERVYLDSLQASADFSDEAKAKFWLRSLYENEFPDWFLRSAEQTYGFQWDTIVRELRTAEFFYTKDRYYGFTGFGDGNILGKYSLPLEDATALGEYLLQRLAALLVTKNEIESLSRSLEQDGLVANAKDLSLQPLEGIVSQQVEEDRLTQLLKSVALPRSGVILKHLADASANFREGKDHSTLGESRSFLQCIIDDVAVETDRLGGHSVALPGATAPRISYLKDVGFLTSDEEAAYRAAWGYLSAGAHPGIVAREEARVGLTLAIEFAQMLAMKYEAWKAKGHRSF